MLPNHPHDRHLYERDFHAWATEQARLVRERLWEKLDADHLAEEIEDLARSQRRELENRLIVLIAHLLKWQFQPERRSHSWEATIAEQRRRIGRLLTEQPSLQPYLEDLFAEAWESSALRAVQETDLPRTHFPDACPYRLDQTLDSGFKPGAPTA
jgi:hypothetical protein